MSSAFPGGTVHQARRDLEEAVRSDPAALARWERPVPVEGGRRRGG